MSAAFPIKNGSERAPEAPSFSPFPICTGRRRRRLEKRESLILVVGTLLMAIVSPCPSTLYRKKKTTLVRFNGRDSIGRSCRPNLAVIGTPTQRETWNSTAKRIRLERRRVQSNRASRWRVSVVVQLFSSARSRTHTHTSIKDAPQFNAPSHRARSVSKRTRNAIDFRPDESR